jgi:hypothetical protein
MEDLTKLNDCHHADLFQVNLRLPTWLDGLVKDLLANPLGLPSLDTGPLGSRMIFGDGDAAVLRETAGSDAWGSEAGSAHDETFSDSLPAKMRCLAA